MATNSKKSLIPRPAHCGGRNDDPLKTKPAKLPKGPKKASQKQPNYSQSVAEDGLLKEDEDAIQHSLMDLEADYARMKKLLEDTEKEAKDRLEIMRKLTEQRKLYTGTVQEFKQPEENDKKTAIMTSLHAGNSEQLADGESLTKTKLTKVTKGDVIRMREKLQQMNENSDRFLKDIQNILQEINELEATSERAGDLSAAEPIPEDDLQALAKAMDAAYATGQTQQEEKEDKDSESQSSAPEDRKDFKPTSASDVFITQD